MCEGCRISQVLLREILTLPLFSRCSGNQHGLVRKYGINMTRRDFREKAETMGWTKYR